jgi:hypothetical protein
VACWFRGPVVDDGYLILLAIHHVCGDFARIDQTDDVAVSGQGSLEGPPKEMVIVGDQDPRHPHSLSITRIVGMP